MSYMANIATVPDWMMKKVLQLVTERNDIYELRSGIFEKLLQSEPRRRMKESLFELEFKATVLLQVELRMAPQLGDIVPEFATALRATVVGSTLSPRERAAIVIIQSDADVIRLNCNLDFNNEEFLRLKWSSLASLLKEGDDE